MTYVCTHWIFGTDLILLCFYDIGLPLGQSQVSDFLIRIPYNSADAYLSSQAFLCSLFSNIYNVLNNEATQMTETNIQVRYRTLARKFRELVADNFSHEPKRTQFYNTVITDAQIVCSVYRSLPRQRLLWFMQVNGF